MEKVNAAQALLQAVSSCRGNQVVEVVKRLDELIGLYVEIAAAKPPTADRSWTSMPFPANLRRR